MKKFLISLLFTFHFSLFTLSFAHWADLAAAEISSGEKTTDIVLTFPTGLVAEMDDDKNQILSETEIHAHHAELVNYFLEHIQLTDTNGQKPSITLSSVAGANTPPDLGLAPGTHSTVKLSYSWQRPPAEILIDYNLFLPGVSTASCLASILHEGETQTFVFTPENRILKLENRQASFWAQAGSFVVLGIEHILTGYDHLLFLLALLVLGGGLRYLLKVVSAFTLAHSITLSLAVLNVIALPSRFVESVIALSIAYVAAENLWRKRDSAERWRWLLTFAFGLIHGLGFAGILQEIEIPRSSLATSLIGFNLGVELGQMVVVSLAFMVLSLFKRWSWQPLLRYGLSLVAMAAGTFWFIERAFVKL
jgi:hydrogenase/urease accessory protein HupE